MRSGITEVAAAIAHPLRFQILQSMNAPPRRISPNEYHRESGHPLGNCSYHFRKLEKAGCIELVETQKRRGATEHYFEPARRAMAWTREWDDLPPVLRQNLAASILRGFVETTGRAIDAGCFDGTDPHVSWGAFYADEQGWLQLAAILQNALEEALALEAEVEKRLADHPKRPRRLISYGLTAFPSAPRP
jgi:hypothetical protein